jgi:hypothetical protein
VEPAQPLENGPHLCPLPRGEGVNCVSDHRGSNSQAIDFESVKIYPIFTVKIENPGKSNT